MIDSTKCRKLNMEELNQVSGGVNFDFNKLFAKETNTGINQQGTFYSKLNDTEKVEGKTSPYANITKV